MEEMGYGGYVDGDFMLAGIERLPAVRGDRWYATVRQMVEQDATVGALIFAVEMALRAVPWSADAADDSPAAQEWAKFLDQCFDDTPTTWADTLADGLSFIEYGYALYEVVHKVRSTEDGASRFDDGKIGWAKWAFRPQETKAKWKFESGEPVAWVQRKPNSSETVDIPLDRCVVFRSSSRRGRPEGPSILKRAYIAWHNKREIETQEAIGIARDLTGLIHIEVPEGVLNGTSVAEMRARTFYQKLIRNVRRGVQEGIMTPSTRDDKGNKLVEVKLLTSGGTRQFDTSKVIDRYRTDIAMTLLADFILLGHQKVGSYSLAESKTSTFTRAIAGWLDMMEEAINEQAVSRLLDLNGCPEELRPKWTHGTVAEMDLKAVGDFLSKMITAKVLPTSYALAKWVSENLGTPVPTQEEWDDMEAKREAFAAMLPKPGEKPDDEDDPKKEDSPKPGDPPVKDDEGNGDA